MNRAQAATEYLIILSVVIIIALIVIGVIGGFPAITKGISERDSAAYWSGGDVGIIRYGIVVTGSGDDSVLVLRNNKNFQISLESVQFDGGTVLDSEFTPALPQNIAPGATLALSAGSGSLACGSATVGGGYSMNVKIIYEDPQFGNTYTFIGEKPLVASCQ